MEKELIEIATQLKRIADVLTKEEKETHSGIEQAKEAVPNGKEVLCYDCGKKTTVPFEPKKDWPVYCAECYYERQDKKKNGK